jgi:hypothetical protein
MRLPRALPGILASAALLLAGAPASATLILALDLPAMVKRADQIAVVDVVSVKAAWNDAHDHIFTTIDVTVVDSWKGTAAPASHIQIVQPGGTVGELTMQVAGMPRFSSGERALLFLHGPTDRAVVVGMTQGKRPITRESGTGRWLVSAPARAGADFVRTTPDSTAAFAARPRPLGDLRDEIRALAGQSDGGGR